MNWNNPKDAPAPHDRDFLGVWDEYTGYPVLSAYSPADKKFSVAHIDVTMKYNGNAEICFIPKTEPEQNLVAWCEVPSFDGWGK